MCSFLLADVWERRCGVTWSCSPFPMAAAPFPSPTSMGAGGNQDREVEALAPGHTVGSRARRWSSKHTVGSDSRAPKAPSSRGSPVPREALSSGPAPPCGFREHPVHRAALTRRFTHCLLTRPLNAGPSPLEEGPYIVSKTLTTQPSPKEWRPHRRGGHLIQGRSSSLTPTPGESNIRSPRPGNGWSISSDPSHSRPSGSLSISCGYSAVLECSVGTDTQHLAESTGLTPRCL